MKFQRQYTYYEVQGMIKIFQGNRAFLNVDNNNIVHRPNASAHANLHAGASYLDQRNRVNTPREPRATGTYMNERDQIAATTYILNSHEVQIQLRQLDLGEQRLGVTAALPVNQYLIAVAEDNSNRGAGNAGHVGRNSQNRWGAGSTHRQVFATQGFVLLIRGVGGLIQIQTSYPIA